MCKKQMKYISEHKKIVFLVAAALFVSAGQLEFIPYTVATALEILGASAAAVVAANKLWELLSKQDGGNQDFEDDFIDSYSEEGVSDVSILKYSRPVKIRQTERPFAFDDRLCDRYTSPSEGANS